ncbi:MAG TPA: ubiquinol-cytochrome c reductase iron-sulfur subunit [Stellaceae bacterium]|nr:ubiquinol-cytochrome c reductase iron-sulfur subunit [Stellaceae bacterium]
MPTDTPFLPAAADDQRRRRDFLTLVVGAMGAIGTVSALWPFFASLSPARDTIAAGAPIDVDVSTIKPGQQITVVWRGHPIFILHRTPDELKMLQEAKDTGLLRDPDSQQPQQPSYAANWHRSLKPEHLVLIGVCTHLGCIPRLEAAPGGDLGANWPGGYFCPCHGSKYDLAGRVFNGVPAPLNLPVPPYNYIKDNLMRVGENPPGINFEISEIEQI